ncbi:MAG: serine hydrolase domain-containing protein [Pseudomonadota bacterium]
MIEIHGHYTEGFGVVADAFADNFEKDGDIGAACTVFQDGAAVVDIHSGWRDRKRTTPWDAATTPAIYSTGKALVALLIAKAVDEGALAYDAPVASYWPAFAAEGKDKVTVVEALSHQAGLPGFPEAIAPTDWLDWDGICAKIAALAPMWSPGTASGYHPITYGFIAGELLRRATGETPGAALRALQKAPEDAVLIGLKETEFAAAPKMAKPPRPPNLGQLNPYKEAAFLKPWSSSGQPGNEAWMRAEIPAANTHATARGLARLMHAFVDGHIAGGERFISNEAIAAATQERIASDNLVLPFHISWAAGLMRNKGLSIYGPNPEAVGHSGFGGACTFADADAGLSFAYVTNRMSEHLMGDPRPKRLIDAVYGSL